MKQFLLLSLLMPFAAYAQSIQSDHTDDFGKVRRIATTRVEFNGLTTSLGGTLTIKESDTVLYLNLFFRAKSATTIDEKTRAILHLDNNELVEVNNTGAHKELTANETGFIVFKLNRNEKAKLQANKVVAYTILTDKAKVKVELSDRQQTAFHKTIYLLETQAEELIALD